jgi:hypothetical protein
LAEKRKFTSPYFLENIAASSIEVSGNKQQNSSLSRMPYNFHHLS